MQLSTILQQIGHGGTPDVSGYTVLVRTDDEVYVVVNAVVEAPTAEHEGLIYLTAD